MYRLTVLSRPVLKTTGFSRVVSFHSTRLIQEQDTSALEKINKGVHSIKNVILENTLKHLSPPPFTGQSENWTQAIREAQTLVKTTDKELAIDPAKLVGRDLDEIKSNITKLLSSNHTFLSRVAKHYFRGEGKHVRPLLVLLIAQATSIAEKRSPKTSVDYRLIDTPISDGLKNITQRDTFDQEHYTPLVTDQGCTILPTQRRLAEISEMIHTASLLHDDVIDASLTRRNLPSANASFGNKMAILGGDFLLGRASVALARLRNGECIELMATCIANLVEGEFMQLKNTKEEKGSNKTKKLSTFDHYMEKTYMKTGSLIALSCKSSAVLGDATEEVATLSFNFGRHLGLAFQLIDDMLDFTVTAAELGKPAGADLKLGLATAPVLFAWEEYPELEPLIKRKFSEEGDEERARDLVYKSDGLKKTLDLAKTHCKYAIDELNKLPPSDARTALIQITEKLLTRKS
ncbi:hypothetical protein G6F56_003007 [Rhizopus delemar]|nr:hypothetical protein G6F56_003007 [Rhizopus delemar]